MVYIAAKLRRSYVHLDVEQTYYIKNSSICGSLKRYRTHAIHVITTEH